MIIVRYLIRETIKSQLAIFFVLFLVFLSQKFISILAQASDGDIPASLILTLGGVEHARDGSNDAAIKYICWNINHFWPTLC